MTKEKCEELLHMIDKIWLGGGLTDQQKALIERLQDAIEEEEDNHHIKPEPKDKKNKQLRKFDIVRYVDNGNRFPHLPSEGELGIITEVRGSQFEVYWKIEDEGKHRICYPYSEEQLKLVRHFEWEENHADISTKNC